MRASKPDTLQIKGAFQKRSMESLEYYNAPEHTSQVNSTRQSGSSLSSCNPQSRHDLTGKSFDNTKTAFGEWTYTLPNTAQHKFHCSFAKRNTQSSISRAHSVPELKTMGSITNNSIDMKQTFIPDKAMSEINEKELECLPIELKRFRVNNGIVNNNVKSSKRKAYLKKVAQIGRKAGLTHGQILQLVQSPKKKTLLQPVYAKERHFQVIPALSP